MSSQKEKLDIKKNEKPIAEQRKIFTIMIQAEKQDIRRQKV